MKYDFVAVGDVVTDEFIRIPEKSARIDNGKEARLSFTFGTKVPFEHAYEIYAVGNSANAAVAASRLGLSSALVSNIGDDNEGEKIIARLKEERVGTDYVAINNGKLSNHHYVLWYNDDRTILIKHEDYMYNLPALEPPRWMYVSSVGEGHERFHDEIAEFVHQHNVKLVFQPGTYQLKLGIKALERVYKNTEFFVCNREEAGLVLRVETRDITELARGIHRSGPRIVAITDGIHGSYASDGKTLWFLRNYPDPKPPFERTGAGDAFSSTFAVALALGKSVEEALMWGPINSMSVVQYVGAQEGLLRRTQLEKYLKEAPPDYQPKAIARI